MLLIIDFIDCPGRDEMYGSDVENKTTSLLVFKGILSSSQGGFDLSVCFLHSLSIIIQNGGYRLCR